jgi:hypothetical protein
MRQYLVNILYYLDGECTQQADLQGLLPVNPTNPETRTIARIAHCALLNPCIQEEQEQANVLAQVFHHVAHNFVDHLLFHIERLATFDVTPYSAHQHHSATS